MEQVFVCWGHYASASIMLQNNKGQTETTHYKQQNLREAG